MVSRPVIRCRDGDDLPALVRLLGEQQSVSGYPMRWPLPFPPEHFVVRAGELAAWVATDDTGEVIGHVSLVDPQPGWDTDAWVEATRAAPRELAAVSVLMVATRHLRTGVGSALLGMAVRRARAVGRTPVLDVDSEATGAVRLYHRLGWQTVGEATPPWLPVGRRPLLLMALPREDYRRGHGVDLARPVPDPRR
jgi:ribosomal protein S18 acetylase RimI-like enzyme